MRAVIQRVRHASVTIDKQVYSQIQQGLLVLLGIEEADDHDDIKWLSSKLLNMRLFSDNEGKMNLSLLDIAGELLVVSQFTLHATTKKGNRPSFIKAAKPEMAIPLYEQFVQVVKRGIGERVKTGEFGAMMDVELINDGPVTIYIDSKNRE